MWQKLPASEIDRRRARSARFTALAWSGAFALAAAFTVKTGYARRRHMEDWDGISWAEFVAELPLILVAALVVYAAVYFYKKDRRRHRIRICTNCSEVQRDATASHCHCGGKIDYLEEYRFVEEDEHA
jgi:hypothetical protein